MKTYSTASSNWKKKFKDNAKIFKNLLKTVKSAFVAYNVNTDAITKIDNNFLKVLDFKDTSKDSKLPKGIDSVKSLKEAVAYSFTNGLAIELKIENEELYSFLMKKLKFKDKRIGGQAGIAANTLAKLGVEKVIVYSNILSLDQSKLFLKKILFPVVKSGKLKLIPANKAGDASSPTRVNIIVEYTKGMKIRMTDGIVAAPRNSRFIISHQPFSSKPVLPKELLIPELFTNITRLFLSGFHHVKEEEANTVFDECFKQLETIKGFNNDCLIHVEYVDLHKDWLKEKFLELLHHIDSFGLNEVEMLNLMRFLNEDKIAKLVSSSDYSAYSLVTAGLYIAKNFNLKRVSIHHINFIISITKKDYPIPISHIVDSNIFGIRVVNSKCVAGEDFLKELRSTVDYPFDSEGLSAADIRYDDLDYNIVVVPNLSPKKKITYTVGLGDTISCAVFFGELVK